MVIQFSRRRMLLTALAPVLAAPVEPELPPYAAYSDSGIPRGLAYYGPGPRPKFEGRGVCVLPAQDGRGWFVFLDMRPADQLDAIDRFLAGARDPETFELAMKGMRPQV